MKTTTKHNPDEATKRLFRQLFEVQLNFEREVDTSDPRVSTIISAIDELLETILEHSHE